MTIQTEIQQLQAKMTAGLIALIMLPLADPIDIVVDLFAPEEIPLHSLGKRPHTNDLEGVRSEAGIIEE